VQTKTVWDWTPPRGRLGAILVGFNIEKHMCASVIEPPRGGVHRPGSAWVILGEARTQSTHISTIPYIEVQVEVIIT
jgi:hypothetical protein